MKAHGFNPLRRQWQPKILILGEARRASGRGQWDQESRDMGPGSAAGWRQRLQALGSVGID